MGVREVTGLLSFLSALIQLNFTCGSGSKELTAHELRFLLVCHLPTSAAMTVGGVDLICSFVFVTVS